MSIFICALERDRVRCLTDTVRTNVKTGKPNGLVARKAEIARNRTFVIGHRGMVLAGNLMSGAARQASKVAEAARVAEIMHDDLPADYAHTDDLLVAGYDHAEGRARAWLFLRSPRGTDRRELEPGLHLVPAPPPGIEVPDGGDLTDARMALHARAQWLHGRGFDKTFCIGGLMILHTVTAEGVTERELGEYPDYAELAAEFGCPRRGGRQEALAG